VTVSSSAQAWAPHTERGIRFVVAADGSPESIEVVRWAVEAAARFDATVTVAEGGTEPADAERLREVLADAGLEIASVVSRLAHLAEVLDELAEAADVIVIGSYLTDGLHVRSHHDLVARLCRHVDCPIVVLPPGERLRPPSPAVVGVDGSAGNRAVLRWARWFAGRLGLPVIASHVIDPIHHGFDDVERASDEDIAVHQEVEHVGVEFVERVDSEPARSLMELADIRDAQLIVVGARDHLSFGGRLLGSVAGQLVDEATRPFVIVPHAYQAEHR
jgi:nucleotide-binding universal stress UspA family protein